MATVYLTRDLKHDRHVALKVLRPELSAAVGVERFQAEIRTTARLTHPHILPLHDSGEAAGMLYYVMPFIDGETVRQRLTRERRFPVEDALRIGQEVAGALAFAHEHDVVHRDIKPENILLQAGHALVADFGIARALNAAGAERMTTAGLVVGTPLYMSPEQATGDRFIDGRSDVYSLACVLFEMLTGEAPFTGDSMQAVLAQRFTQPAPSVAARRGDVPNRVDAALRHALARDPGERTASATQFAAALAGVMAAAATAAAALGAMPRDGTPCIAVLPFANMSADADTEFFSDGITEELLNALTKVRGLRVIARTSAFAFKGKNVDVREIGRQLGAGHILEGSVRKAGNSLRITAQLVDGVSGHHLWSERYDRDMSDVFAVQDELTEAIRAELAQRLLGIGPAQATGTPNIDPETYELFLRGRHLVERRVQGMRQGMELLRQVVERAPLYAEGYAALADAYGMLGFYIALSTTESFSRVREYATRALELDPTLARAHTALGHAAFYLDWDWSAARAHYARAIEIAPDDPWCASVFAIYWSSIGRTEKALCLAEHAVSVDPLNPSALTQLAMVHNLAYRFEECIAVCDRIIEIAPDFSEAWRWKGAALDYLGRHYDAAHVLGEAVRISNRHSWSIANHGRALFHLGRVGEARTLAAELEERAKSEPVPAFELCLLACCSKPPDMDRAFALLDRAIEAREFWLVMARVEPAMMPLYGDPRFGAAIRRIGIPEVMA